MSKILLQKTEPFSPARSSTPCGNAALALDRIAPEYLAIPLPLGAPRERVAGEGLYGDGGGEGEKEAVISILGSGTK